MDSRRFSSDAMASLWQKASKSPADIKGTFGAFMRPLYPSVAFFALLLSSAAVFACAGGDESTGIWSLDRVEYNGDSGVPFLSPGNDTRFNLQFLMLDAHAQPAPTEEAGTEVQLDFSPLLSLHDLDTPVKGGVPAPSPGEGKDPPVSETMFSDDEGSRCVSSQRGKQDFIAAVQASALSADEKTLVTNARDAMAPNCLRPDASAPAAPQAQALSPSPSPAAQDFFTYLAGAKSFYDGDFDQALASFSKLAKAEGDWLREAGRYMTGRTLLNKAEIGVFANLDGIAEPKVTDKDSLAAAETELTGYLAAYPAGRYAASARGLLRRLYWLAGDRPRLSAEYGWQIAHAGDPQVNLGAPDLAREIDSKFLTGVAAQQSHDPNLLAVVDLMRLRSRIADKPVFASADLEAQAPDFAGHEDLFAFLRAARAYYADRDFAGTLKLLGPAPTGPLPQTYLAFSRETLRGQALMSSGQLAAAADHWRALLPLVSQPWQKEAVELGLAMSWEKAGTVNKVFEKDTRIASPRIRGVLLRYAAGPILLRQAIADPQSTPGEKALARFTLLYKEATRGHYTGFLRDYSPEEIAKGDAEAAQTGVMKSAAFVWSGASEPYKCPTLKAVISELAANAEASHGLLCLAEFIRTGGVEDSDTARPGANELGGGKSIFPGEVFSRGEIYKKLLAESATPENDKAYVLYRLVNCYGPSGNNGCGGKDVDKPQRKAWFQALKTKYGSTPWAHMQTYYW
jgi:hypothetical protein